MPDNPEVKVKILTHYRELVDVEALHRQVFRRPEPYTARELVAVVRAGGLVLGGFLGGRMVGFSIALMALEPAGRYLFGRTTGVLREHRDLGLGKSFKLAQRSYVLSRGLERMEWVFPPMVARTAHFHLTSIGTTSRAYEARYHLSTGGRSGPFAANDRLLASWELASDRVEARLSGQRPEIPEGDWVTRVEVQEGLAHLVETFQDETGPRLLLEIPYDLYAYGSRPEAVTSWRRAAGVLLDKYVNEDKYVVTECFGPVVGGLRRPFYLLERQG
jgi:predicted GNAT superfamily acetyltransferase